MGLRQQDEGGVANRFRIRKDENPPYWTRDVHCSQRQRHLPGLRAEADATLPHRWRNQPLAGGDGDAGGLMGSPTADGNDQLVRDSEPDLREELRGFLNVALRAALQRWLDEDDSAETPVNRGE